MSAWRRCWRTSLPRRERRFRRDRLVEPDGDGAGARRRQQRDRNRNRGLWSVASSRQGNIVSGGAECRAVITLNRQVTCWRGLGQDHPQHKRQEQAELPLEKNTSGHE